MLEEISSLFNEVVAISWVLRFSVGHDSGLVPDANHQALFTSRNAGTSTSLSSKVDGVSVGVVSDHHILLVVHSDSSLSSLSVSLGGLDGSSEFIYLDFFLGSVFLFDFESILAELESSGSSPWGSIKTVNGGMLIDVGQSVLLGFLIEVVL